ncbi:hypothetical protein NDU88_008361 [Pleurodeles waltl]|uniref:Uncharacterized protein n=1 Tax=Pleurodeles waltl TaxID=8319 RepID=A0AAV7PNX9_PLEWA|nr:hypothetical protein NDU88_008361 [Pleurodeles waltl]
MLIGDYQFLGAWPSSQDGARLIARLRRGQQQIIGARGSGNLAEREGARLQSVGCATEAGSPGAWQPALGPGTGMVMRIRWRLRQSPGGDAEKGACPRPAGDALRGARRGAPACWRSGGVRGLIAAGVWA